uniref:Interferon regulatory factor 5 n=1 Tax=Branchiostoma belcheri tsingtauense TaxID=155462 RepID=A0A0A7P700_BRABE|nr:interferon regulatory factor 5 [Branchiostoma belcheri tsingtauense]
MLGVKMSDSELFQLKNGSPNSKTRQRLRPWLIDQINSGRVPNLQWVDQDNGIFRIPWKHFARADYKQDRDCMLFMEWAIHTGKFHPGLDEPDPTRWKANFRCALNQNKDILQLDHRTYTGINRKNPYRIYQMIPEQYINEEFDFVAEVDVFSDYDSEDDEGDGPCACANCLGVTPKRSKKSAHHSGDVTKAAMAEVTSPDPTSPDATSPDATSPDATSPDATSSEAMDYDKPEDIVSYVEDSKEKVRQILAAQKEFTCQTR